MTTIFGAMLRADRRRSRTWRWNAGCALSVAALGISPLVGCAEADPNLGNLALGDGAEGGDSGSVIEFESDVKELQQALSPGGSNVSAQVTVPLRQAFYTTFRPSGSQAVTVRMDQLAGSTDPMLVVLRWTNRQAWETGSLPDRNSQAGFEVVGFNDDFSGLAPRVGFVPDGRSYYTVFVMPYADATTWGSGRLTIEDCIGCNAQEIVPVQGYTRRGNIGNVFQVDSTSGATADPWVFAMRLFASTDNATLLKGVGMANDQGLKGNTNNRSNLHTTFSLEGQPKDIVFVTNYAATTGSPSASLLIGTEAPLPGLATRPTNTTCIAPATSSAIKEDLALTNCFDMVTRKPVAGAIPYEVAHGFWSDDVIKERFLVLPNETSISVDAAGTWTLPVGGMMIKNFYYGSEIFETRFVVKTAGAPLAYTYRWDGSTATRVDDDTVNSHKELSSDPYLGYVDWEYPRTAQCQKCHMASVNGFFLGLNTRQFNTEIEYASTGIRANQIATLQSLSILPQVMPSLTVPGFEPRPAAASSSVEQPETARAYLDVNCAYCHNERYMSQWKAGYEYAFSDMGVCNVVSEHSALGHDFVEPGHSELSYISERAHDRGSFLQMPNLATKVVDQRGLSSVDTWINKMQSCSPPKKSIQMLDVTTCLKAPVRTPPATAKNLDAVTCSSSDPAQGFEIVDDGGGYVSLRPTLIDPNAPPGSTDCIMNVNTSVVRTSCVGTKHWYRDYQPGGSYQLVDAVTKECLTKFTYGARLEPCKGISSQLWKNANPPI